MEGASVAVVDVGSGSVKFGWAGDDCPTAMPAIVAPPNAKPADGPRIDCLEQQGSDALGPRMHPVSRGQVRDWEQLERLWRQVLEQEMAVHNTETIAAMVVEPPSVPAQDRAKLAETLFETLRLTSVCFANSASLSLLASGRVSGLSVETGAGVTHVCPVFQGLVLAHAQRRVEVGGQDISGLVCQTLRQHGVQIEFADARQVKETYSYLKGRFIKREPSVMSFSLPDGSTVELEDSLVAQSAEVLFETPGRNVAEAALQSLALCDPYARDCVSQNVVISGGTSMLPGFGDRIYDHLHEHGADNACVFPSTQYYESGYTSQRRHAAWIGGSILASLTAFSHLKITRVEWEENAEAVTRAKRF